MRLLLRHLTGFLIHLFSMLKFSLQAKIIMGILSTFDSRQSISFWHAKTADVRIYSCECIRRIGRSLFKYPNLSFYYVEWACQIFDPYVTSKTMVEISESMLVGQNINLLGIFSSLEV
ncbi:hypothetical protein HAX54_025777 [Datura stramonium]|uniref:Uncharacterized protein n=1 Tax=Datura stramonium TaxID=4076 RepID=A0ABS8S6S8_DATST|nr:hypothetical protein [Datura stramonium]